MKTFIYSMSVLLLLSSCGSGGGSGSSTPAKPLNEQLGDASSATDFSKTILPERYTVIKANLSYEEQKEKYTVGCKTQGEPSYENSQIDPKLLVGHIFKIQEGRSRLLDTDSYQITERKIAELDGQRIKTEINFLEASFSGTPFTSIDQVFVSKPHIVTTGTYGGQNGSGDFDFVANYTGAARDFLAANPPTNATLNCSVSWDNSTSATDKISYSFSGHQITAYLQKDSNSGEVACDKGSKDTTKVSLGKGRREVLRITTNETVRQAMLYCGGEDVFRMERIVLDSGKVVKSEVEKILSAPLR